jgi:hypothetical protein
LGVPLQKKRGKRPSAADPAATPALAAAPAELDVASLPLHPHEATPEMLAARESLPEKLAWHYNPWTDSKARGWKRPPAALAILLLCSGIAGWSLAVPRSFEAMAAWGALAFGLAILMCASLFLPVGYRLDRKGVTVTFLGAPSFRPWEHYRNFYVHDTGVHLTTMPEPSALDPFRGHFIQYGAKGRRSDVVGYLDAYIPRRRPETKS